MWEMERYLQGAVPSPPTMSTLNTRKRKFRRARDDGSGDEPLADQLKVVHPPRDYTVIYSQTLPNSNPGSLGMAAQQICPPPPYIPPTVLVQHKHGFTGHNSDIRLTIRRTQGFDILILMPAAAVITVSA